MANAIKRIRIEGFKKFKSFDLEFDPCMNILIGENESGKSTILDAIKLVLCQEYRTADKAYLFDLFNHDLISKHKKEKSYGSLPVIKIEIEFDLDGKGPYAQDFWGENHSFDNQARYGVKFECCLEEDYAAELATEIAAGKVPVEYYSLKWVTFSRQTYVLQKKPLNFIAIDNSDIRGAGAINYFSRDLFNTFYDSSTKTSARSRFREGLKEVFENLKLTELDDGQGFVLNDKKIPLENVLSVATDDILLENRGKGRENLIKTQVALRKSEKRAPVQVITLEEPENHLSYMNMRKMIEEISTSGNRSQLIIATHSNMIVNSLGVRKLIWIAENGEPQTLKRLGEDDEKFFAKADTSRLLDFILSDKVILVEGPTEYMLIPKFVKQFLGKTCDELGVAVIACDGLSYKRYLRVAEACNKRVAVITDNDGKQKNVEEAAAYNQSHDKQHIFLHEDTDLSTWEFCVFKNNSEILEAQFPGQDSAEYKFNGISYPGTLGYMLTNKAETAYKMLSSDNVYVIPDYVKEAIEWLQK